MVHFYIFFLIDILFHFSLHFLIYNNWFFDMFFYSFFANFVVWVVWLSNGLFWIFCAWFASSSTHSTPQMSLMSISVHRFKFQYLDSKHSHFRIFKLFQSPSFINWTLHSSYLSESTWLYPSVHHMGVLQTFFWLLVGIMFCCVENFCLLVYLEIFMVAVGRWLNAIHHWSLCAPFPWATFASTTFICGRLA